MKTKILKTVISFVLLFAIFSIGIYFIFPDTASNSLAALERKVGGLHQNNVTVDGLKIEYLEGGEGETLLLLHGFGADKDNWTRLAKYLTPHYRIIAPDLPVSVKAAHQMISTIQSTHRLIVLRRSLPPCISKPSILAAVQWEALLQGPTHLNIQRI